MTDETTKDETVRDETTKDETVRIENCRIAMKAALEAIQDYCGMAPTGVGEAHMVEVRGVMINVPDEIREIATQETKSLTSRQTDIEGSSWARDKAAEICGGWWNLLTAEGHENPMEDDVRDECIMRVAAEIGEAILR